MKTTEIIAAKLKKGFTQFSSKQEALHYLATEEFLKVAYRIKRGEHKDKFAHFSKEEGAAPAPEAPATAEKGAEAPQAASLEAWTEVPTLEGFFQRHFTDAAVVIREVKKLRKGRKILLSVSGMMPMQEDVDKYFPTMASVPVGLDTLIKLMPDLLRPAYVERGACLRVKYCSNCIFIG